ncbi:MAG: hypothetical protein HUU47_05995 [Bacteroidetes bacterium]|nr:hypothetical protein [Bacteroidota bacterium]
MKLKRILFYSITVFGLLFLLNSCGDGESTNPAPEINLIAEGGSLTADVSMDGDTTFKIVFSVSDDSKKIKKVEVTSTVDGRVTPQFDTTINETYTKIKLTRRTLARKATEKWTITATDDQGESSSKSINITTISDKAGDPLISYDKDALNNPLRVYNFLGTKAGAFDLLDGTPKVSGDNNAEKDVHDSVTTSELSNWPHRWTSKNGTLFKKVTSYTYDNIVNTGQLDAAWDASGTATKWLVVNVGDLIIAKLRGTNTKVLLKITDVVVTSGTGENNDYVQFNFKKKL